MIKLYMVDFLSLADEFCLYFYFLFSCAPSTGTLGATLARHRSKPRVYIGCMKSGPVLTQK